MRVILILLVFLFISKFVFSQKPSTRAIQNQMAQVVKELNQRVTDLEKQIADAKKNNEDPETIKGLEDQLAMLNKQGEMIGGGTKGIDKMPKNPMKKAIEKEA